ncbi:MAG: hypothetical protein ABIG68_08125, partial [Acidobacteriota bacterium]
MSTAGRTLQCRLLSLIALLVVGATGAWAQGGDIEPNNSPGQASPVRLPFFTVFGQVSSPQDVDYYRFTGEAGKELIIWL